MNLSRREFIRLVGLISAGAAAGGACAPVYGRLGGAYQAPAPLPELHWPAFQALNRLTYGPDAASLRQVSEMGLAGWVEEQLAPATIDDEPASFLLRPFEALAMEANELEAKGRQEVVQQLRAATLLRQVYSQRQLYERLVGFWTDHFNISVDKGGCWYLKVVDDREVIRQHALGRFEELLLASARSPAMLVYLDNQANASGQPNENYAREVMELHSLGVDGGYDQQDVMELARCLTGWSVKDHFWLGEFTFNAELHDTGAKQVLGQEIQAAGKEEAEQVLVMLANHHSTAEHLAVKLVQYFLVDDPPNQAPEVVRQVSKTFRESRGDLKAALRTLLLDGLVPRAGRLPPKFKRPLHFVTSALRASSAASNGGPDLQFWLGAMGQPLFAWPTPDGPPASSAPWKTSLLPRWQFSLALSLDEIEGTEIQLAQLARDVTHKEDGLQLEHLSRRLLGGAPSPPLLRAGRKVMEEIGQDNAVFQSVLLAGMIASPQFQWR
jgi:uncharacterized protein (DUF1800 family)